MLSCEDVNLSKTDTVIAFMLRKLADLETTISINLPEKIKTQMDERLNLDLMSLFRCLKDLTNVPSKNTIGFAGKLLSEALV